MNYINFTKETQGEKILLDKIDKEKGMIVVTNTLQTHQDRNFRYQQLYDLMDQMSLQGLLLSGDGIIKFVNGEYASGWGVYALIPRYGDPVLFQGSVERAYVLTPVYKNKKDYWIQDIRLFYLPNVVEAFAEKKLLNAKIGFNYNNIPTGLFLALKDALKKVEIEIVEISNELKEITIRKQGNYLKIIEEAVDIVDTCVQELPEILHTGMYEYEVKAVVESIMTGRGADGTLILLNSDKNDISSPAIPTDHAPKALSKGDYLVAELTVNYRGCWVQKIAIYSFGEPDEKVMDMFRVVNESIWQSIKMVKPGVNARDLINDIDDHIEARGYLSPRKGYLSGPQGHLSGFDMDEGTFSPDKDFILDEGMLFVLHPGAALKDWKAGKTAIFGPGTMFLVTKDGVRSLNRTTNEIYVIDK